MYAGVGVKVYVCEWKRHNTGNYFPLFYKLYFPPNTETTFKGLLLSLFCQLVLFMWNTRWYWWNWAWIFHNSALNQFLFVSWHCDTTCKQTQLKYKYRICNFCNISATDLRYVFFSLVWDPSCSIILPLPQHGFHWPPSTLWICTFTVTKPLIVVWMKMIPTVSDVWICVSQFVALFRRI